GPTRPSTLLAHGPRVRRTVPHQTTNDPARYRLALRRRPIRRRYPAQPAGLRVPSATVARARAPSSAPTGSACRAPRTERMSVRGMDRRAQLRVRAVVFLTITVSPP